MLPKQIVAMGGGGWGMEPDNPLLDRYIYNYPTKKSQKYASFLRLAEIHNSILNDFIDISHPSPPI